MKIHVSSREAIGDLLDTLDGTIRVISITDPQEPIWYSGNFPECNILRLQFDDLDRMHPALKNIVYFNSTHVHQILVFLARCGISPSHDGPHNLIVHCEAGVSRSPAVAAAISDYLNKEGRFPISYYFRHYAPNVMVFTMLRSALGF